MRASLVSIDFIHLFIHLFIHSFIHIFIYLFVQGVWVCINIRRVNELAYCLPMTAMQALTVLKGAGRPTRLKSMMKLYSRMRRPLGPFPAAPSASA